MVRKLIKALLAGSVLIPTLSFGLGLGEIHLHSGLNQNLNAEIDLLSVEPSEADKITVSLAPYDTFSKIGLERAPVLSQLVFQIDKHSDGSPYIRIKSSNPINEPFLDFLVQVNWPSGQILREYTVLLDPPQVSDITPAPVTAPIAQEEQPAQQEQTQPPSQAAIPPATPKAATPPTPAAEAQPEQPKASETEAAPEQQAAEQPPEETAEPEAAQNQPAVAEAAKPGESTGGKQPTVTEQPAKPVAGQPKPSSEQPKTKSAATPLVAPQQAAQGETAPLSYGPVKHNQTLYTIAKRMRPDESVSVNQAMIALFNANPQAFMHGNINRLRKGAVLRIDDPAAFKAISEAEATRVVARHNRAWQDYRAKLAENTPVRNGAEAPESSTVTAGSAVAGKEEPKLTLMAPTKGSDTKSSVGGTGKAGADVESLRKELLLAQESAEARRKENEDLNKRLKELEGQLDKMQKLLALKDDNLAAMQQKLAAQQSAGTAPAKPAQPQPEIAKPAQPEATKPAQPETAAPVQPESAKPTEATKPAESTLPEGSVKPAEPSEETNKPVVPPTAGTSPTPSATQGTATSPQGGLKPAVPSTTPLQQTPKVVTKPKPYFPPPPEPTSFIDDLLDNPMMLGIGATGIVLLILGVVLVLKRRRAGRGFQESILTVGATSSMMKGKGENPASETSFLSDLAVSGMSSKVHEEDDVDPLTEADVYMAYNRFQQAEELLKEALRHSPERDDLNAKLLEVYYRAKNDKEFEKLAEARSSSLQQDSSAWQKIMSMGHELNPSNPLFQGAEGAPAVATSASAGGGNSTSNDVFDIGLDLDALSSEMEEAGAGSSDFNVDLGLDFSDLGNENEPSHEVAAAAEEPSFSSLGDEMIEAQPVATEPVSSEETLLGDFDFDLSALAEEPASEEEQPASLEFTDLDLGAPLEESTLEAEEPALSTDFGDFDLSSLGEETPAEEEAASSIDFGELDLGGSHEETETFDLGSMDLDTSSDEQVMDLGDLGDFGDQDDFGSLDEIGTKLDLAKAYVDMGDADGARGMLEEVILDGSDEQKRQAKELLEQIG